MNDVIILINIFKTVNRKRFMQMSLEKGPKSSSKTQTTKIKKIVQSLNLDIHEKRFNCKVLV